MIIYVALVVEILVYILGKITKDEKTGNALKKAFKIIRIVMIVFIGKLSAIIFTALCYVPPLPVQ